MFESYNPLARKVVSLARNEVLQHKHLRIGTEHILLGLLRMHEGFGSRVLEDLGVTYNLAQDRVSRIVSFEEGETPAEVPLTRRAEKLLVEVAQRFASQRGSRHVSDGDVLQALVAEEEGVAARILADFGVDAARVELELNRLRRIAHGLTAQPSR